MAQRAISAAPRLILEATGASISGRACRDAAVDPRIPAVQIRGRWFIEEADLPAILAAFGLAPAKRQRTVRRSAAA